MSETNGRGRPRVYSKADTDAATTVLFRLTKEEKRALRIRAAESETSMALLVADIVRNYLNQK